MKKIFVCLATLGFLSTTAHADSIPELVRKTDKAATVLHQNTKMSDNGIPISLMNRATCVATIPDVIKAGLVFGGRYGEGLVSCRTARGWSAPSFISLAGGSWGLQIGVQSTDLVLVFTRANAIERFSKNNFTLGADVSIAAGPVGRSAQAGTDYELSSEIYSYSKSKGLFAGLALEGSSLRVSRKNNLKVYGEISTLAILQMEAEDAPRMVWPYALTLEASTF